MSTPMTVSEITLTGRSGEKWLVSLAPETARPRIVRTPTSEAASAAPVAGISRRGEKARAGSSGANRPWAIGLRSDMCNDIVILS